MNFIKKKLKSHKKEEEEEEEYEKAVYEQSLQPNDQKMKNTEEWQFFQQLSMKVQDTVQKTQTTLNKLKDIHQDSIGKDDKDLYALGSESSSRDFVADGSTYGANASKISSAPPRPPPPTADKAISKAEIQMDSDMAQSLTTRAPPKVPPGVDSHLFSETSFSATSAKISPARPPPPLATKNFAATENEFILDQSFSTSNEPQNIQPNSNAFSLLDEFGFQPADPVVQTMKSDFQDLLFLDVKEDADPFDTSFVDVTNIVSHYQPSNNESNTSDAILNPFTCPDLEKNIKDDNSHSDKKNFTNPFFSAPKDDVSHIAKIDDIVWSAHNPFSTSNTETTMQSENLIIDNLLLDNNNTSNVKPVKNEDMIPSSIFTSENTNEMATKGNVMEMNDILNMDNSFVSDSCSFYQSDDKLPQLGGSNEPSHYEKVNEVFEPNMHSKDNSILWQADAASDNLQNDVRMVSEISNHSISLDKNIIDNDIKTTDILDANIAMNDDTESVDIFNSTSNMVGLEEEIVNNATDDLGIYSTVSDQDLMPQSAITISSVSDTVVNNTEYEVTTVATPTEAIEADQSINFMADAANSTVGSTCSPPFDEGHNSFSFQVKTETKEEYDEFSAKFESAKDGASSDFYDPFSCGKPPSIKKIQEGNLGFGSMDEFDPFKVFKEEEKPHVLKKEISRDSFEEYDNEADFSVVIKPKVKDSSASDFLSSEPPKLLPPPPKTPTKAFDNNALRFNPFDKDFTSNASQVNQETDQALDIEDEDEHEPIPALGEAGVRKADSVESPLSPLFDEDTSMPLEVFPKPYPKEGWEMVLRQPNKKKLTGNRFWKKIFVKLSENSVLQLFNKIEDKVPFQELPLQACYSLSEVGAQQYDQYGKIFTVKLQYKFYRERVGVRPGQISKVTQGQVTSMGDVAKLGLPLQHSPQTSQLLKLGTHSYTDIKYFMQEVEDAFFRMIVHRDRVLTYKTEEIQVIAQDEFCVEQSKTGRVEKQLARVRIFFLAFITGMPSVEVGLNDINRQGKEVVGRYDIIPVVTEEWIRLEDCEFHSCIIQEEFKKTRIIKFHPPDACLFELLRFRIRPPRNRELPLQVRVFMTISSSRVEIRSDILVPGYSSRKQGQVPCENIQIRFPIPECWIYLFRTEKHFRYGSKKSTARRPGKIKGLERIIGAAQNLDPSLIEVSAGQAKYEHVFHAVVWRIPRLPKEGQGAYTQQLFLLRTELTAFDQIPDSYEPYVDVEFTMPATYVSHTTVRSVSVSDQSPPEKYVRYVSKHEYKVEIEFKSPDDMDGLVSSPNVNVPVTSAANVLESTEDEKDEEESD